jgi:hypothetical protein
MIIKVSGTSRLISSRTKTTEISYSQEVSMTLFKITTEKLKTKKKSTLFSLLALVFGSAP